jgi:hypothetical protein
VLAERAAAGNVLHPALGSMVRATFLSYLTASLALISGIVLAVPPQIFTKGDPVQLTRSESLLLDGKYYAGAPKGQEFVVIQHDQRRGLVFVPFVKDDGAVVALSVASDALEASPPDAWSDLLRGVESFRDGRYEQARRFLLRAAQTEEYRAIATSISARVNAALIAKQRADAGNPQTLATALQPLRDGAEQLTKLGHYSLALAFDQGADRLGANVPGAPPSKLDRADVSQRVTIAAKNLAQARQALALRKSYKASSLIDQARKADPARPDLKKLEERIHADLKEAEERFAAAQSMRRFEKGAVHALTAIEHGLKRAADHPKLLSLRKEMESLFEERTAPPVTPQLISAAASTLSAKVLEDGHRLYTTRCTECHELELLDSKSMPSWRAAVAGMARRANLTPAEEARILDYLAVAQSGLK